MVIGAEKYLASNTVFCFNPIFLCSKLKLGKLVFLRGFFIGHLGNQTCPMNFALFVCLFICPFIYSQCKISELTISFFWFLCIKLDSNKVKKVTISDFWKSPVKSREPKKWQEKMKFGSFDKNLIHPYDLFWIWNCYWYSNFLHKQNVWKNVRHTWFCRPKLHN